MCVCVCAFYVLATFCLVWFSFCLLFTIHIFVFILSTVKKKKKNSFFPHFMEWTKKTLSLESCKKKILRIHSMLVWRSYFFLWNREEKGLALELLLTFIFLLFLLFFLFLFLTVLKPCHWKVMKRRKYKGQRVLPSSQTSKDIGSGSIPQEEARRRGEDGCCCATVCTCKNN